MVLMMILTYILPECKTNGLKYLFEKSLLLLRSVDIVLLVRLPLSEDICLVDIALSADFPLSADIGLTLSVDFPRSADTSLELRDLVADCCHESDFFAGRLTWINRSTH